MGIALREEQVALAESVAKFAARHAPTATTRRELDDLAAGIRPAWWDALCEQGLLSLHLPARAGGDEAGLEELAVVVEETGRGLVPGPFLPTVLASSVVARLASGAAHDDLLARFARGATGTCATTADGLTAERAPGDQGWLVSGTTVPAIGALSAQAAVLGAQAPGGTVSPRGDDPPITPRRGASSARTISPRGDDPPITPRRGASSARTIWFTVGPDQLERLGRDRLGGVDLTRDIGAFRLDSVLIGDDQVLAGDEDAVRSIAALLFAAEAAGLARWCQETGLAYAKVREQFGQTIGSFQAIKHKCARLLVELELMTASAWDAAVAAGQDGDQFALAAAAAAVLCLPGSVDLALETVTLLGGIGYTWEHDAHLYWRRAMSLASLLGPHRRWERRLGELARTITRRSEVHLDAEPAGLREEVAALLAQARALDRAGRRAFLADAGLVSPHYPRPYGRGADAAAQVVIAQEFARAGLPMVSTLIGEWALPTILAHGTDEQRERFVMPTLRGEITWCQFFSEPGAGSDLASLATRAERVPGGWRLNGQKVWTSSAREADWGICLARTDPTVAKHRGLSYFLVDTRSPGLEIRPLREANGGYMFNEVFFTDVFVPDEMLVGGPGDGWRLARTTLGNERVSMGTGLSGARRDIAVLAESAPGRDAAVLADLARLTARHSAQEALGARALARSLSGLQPGAEASGLKLAAAWNRLDVTRAVLGWHGPEAATTDGPGGAAAHAYLSCPPVLIGGGTAEIQLNVIGERVLGLPRS
jgi:alkylation response protein AidB-like acyl-CoA dehydrogenase